MRELNLMAAAGNFLLIYAIFLMYAVPSPGIFVGRNTLFSHVCWLFTIGLLALGYTNGCSIMMIISGGLIGYRLRFGHAGLPDANYQLG